MTAVAFTLFYSKMLTFTLLVGFVIKEQTTTTGKMLCDWLGIYIWVIILEK